MVSIAKKRKQTVTLLAFVLPALLFYAMFMLAPAFGGVWYSLTNWNGLNPTYRMVGFANYVEALTDDPAFLKSVWFTLKYVMFMVVLQNAFALLLAILVESRRRSKVLFRTIFFMPNMISMIIGGFMWMTARGESEQITKAKNILIWSILGLIVIFAAFGITRFVLTVILE